MKLTKGIISRDEAIKLAPDFVGYTENSTSFRAVHDAFNKMKRGQKAITYDHNSNQYVIGKISSVNLGDFRAVDGPVVRFSNGEYSWRVDGDGYAAPIK